MKKIITKILLSIGIITLAMISMALVSESGNDNSAGIRLIPGAIMVFGLIYVWLIRKK